MGFVIPMDNAADEPQVLSNVVAIEPNVLAGGFGVLPYPFGYGRRLGESVCCVARSRNLHGHRSLQVKNVFIPEEKHCPGTLDQLLVVVPIVIRAPRDLRNIKVAGKAEFPAEAA